MPNERWQADITHWKLADGTEVEVLQRDRRSFPVPRGLARTDRSSRSPTSWRASTKQLQHTACRPRCSPTTGRCSPRLPRKGTCAIELETAALGIRYLHSRPYHPQTCGKVERIHQTLKQWLDKHQPAQSVEGLQAELDRFRSYYNDVRPHRAIDRRTPAEAFLARPTASPSLPPVPIEGHVRVRRDKIDITGVITLRHNSRLHHIGLGRRLVGTRVLALVDGLRIRVITEDGALLRELTLDPSRDYQPHGRS